MSRRKQVSRRNAVGELVPFGIPVVVVAVVVVGVLVGPSAPPTVSPHDVEVVSSASACPALEGLGVSVGQAVPGEGTTLTPLAEDAEPVDAAADAWTPAAVAGGAVVRQTGDGGGVAFASGVLTSGGGLAVSACPRVADESWFVGAGTSERRSTAILLTNLADVPGVVDVELWSPAGRLDAIGGDGIAVAAGETRVVQVGDLAVGAEDVAVHVTRRRGAVATAFLDASTAGLTGSELVPSSGVPSTETVLPGVAAGGTRVLLVANPGEVVATVEVRQTGADGDLVPLGLEALQVPAETVLAVPLPETVGSEATAFRVLSDEPVLPVVRVTSSQTDYAYATSAPVWSGPVVVPIGLADGARRPVLHLVAADAESAVTVEVFDAAMKSVGSTAVTVGPKVLTQVDLADTALFESPDVAYAVVTASEPVHGTAVYRADDKLALLPLAEAPVDARGPRVQPGF
ncbi:MAG: DUF5719 family protein [Aeromicrobium sp.]|uniref:DUF5719 family protein n=1 Tax=Aeromicrobium sp. TaxID=1871063 RepID=UPI0039E4A94F